jgi:hypothetical protein
LPVQIDGEETGDVLTITEFKLAPISQPDLESAIPVTTSFDGKFDLLGYEAPESVRPNEPFTVDLYWEAVAPDGEAYTVFVHLLDPSGNLVVQADSPPQEGRFPTSLWAAGERIRDPHLIAGVPDLDANHLQLAAGFYDPQSGERLPAVRADGTRWADDVVLLGKIDFAVGP